MRNSCNQKTDATKIAPNTDTTVTNPLQENPHVQELYVMLNENNRDTALIDALIDCVINLEKNLTTSEMQIATMKSQISDMKEIQDHPIKHALQATVKGLEQDVKEPMPKTGLILIIHAYRSRGHKKQPTTALHATTKTDKI